MNHRGYYDDAVEEIDSLFREYSAIMCEEQKKICAYEYHIVKYYKDIDKTILNAPLPSGLSDMVCLSKEELIEIIEWFAVIGELDKSRRVWYNYSKMILDIGRNATTEELLLAFKQIKKKKKNLE